MEYGPLRNIQKSRSGTETETDSASTASPSSSQAVHQNSTPSATTQMNPATAREEDTPNNPNTQDHRTDGQQSKNYMTWIEDTQTPETLFSPMSPDQTPHVRKYDSSPFCMEGHLNQELNDTFDDAMIAHAIAETNHEDGNHLPPGVSLRDQQEDAMFHLLANQIFPERYSKDQNNISPALERRLRDFRFAQGKRREKYGNVRPWGILGLYDHLACIRVDEEWAEDAAWRRDHGEPYLSWTDFEENRVSGFNRPFFTYIVMVVCTICLFATIGVNNWSVEPLNVNPMIGPSASTLVDMGAKQSSLIVNYNEWYRLFTPMVLHAGFIHYFLNMLALWFIGGAVEKSHGFVSAAVIFIIPAIGGTIFSAIFLPEYISVGASGGIFGFIGACMADIVSNWTLLFSKHINDSDENMRGRHMKVLLWLAFDMSVNCIIGLTPFIDNFTHLGGMLYGFLCGLCTMERVSKTFFGVKANDWYSRSKDAITRFGGIIATVVLVFITVGILAESDGKISPCSGCRYVSCVPFPFGSPNDKKWWHCDDCDTVTAGASQDKTTRLYTSLKLTCPDGEIKPVNLIGQNVSDKNDIRNRLPSYCRNFCTNVFSN